MKQLVRFDGASDRVTKAFVARTIQHWQDISRRTFEEIKNLVQRHVEGEILTCFERFDESGLLFDARYSLFLP